MPEPHTIKKQRSVLLDSLRGFAIILVVAGHSIQFNDTYFDRNILFRLIYSFHMPLFMFISGFLAFATLKATWESVMKRFISLVIPFFSWFVILYLVDGSSGNFFNALIRLLAYPDTGLWFLWILFLLCLLLFVAMKICKKRPELVLIVFILALNVLLIRIHLKYGTWPGLLAWHLVFFTFGFIFNKYNRLLNRKIIGWVSLGIFCLAVPFWTRSEGPLFSGDLHFHPVVNKLVLLLYKYTVPVSGITAIYCHFISMKPASVLTRMLAYCGTITLEIYAVHFYFMRIIPFLLPLMSFPLRVTLIFLISLAGSILFKKIVEKNDLLVFILFGKRADTISPERTSHPAHNPSSPSHRSHLPPLLP